MPNSGAKMLRQSSHEGGKFVSPTHRPPLPPRKYSWYSFLLEAESTHGHSAAGRFISMKNSIDNIGNRSRELSVCSPVPQPLRYRVPPSILNTKADIQRRTHIPIRSPHFGASDKNSIRISHKYRACYKSARVIFLICAF
jgi:hypothetical protein